MKKLSLLLAITLLLHCLAACQGQPQNEQATEPLPIENRDGTLAQWMKDEITSILVNEDWLPNAADIQWDDGNGTKGIRYYGIENGYVIIFFEAGPAELGNSRYISKYCFSHSCHFRLLAYKDGNLYHLHNLYGDGLIGKAAIHRIWGTHCNYGKKHNGQ